LGCRVNFSRAFAVVDPVRGNVHNLTLPHTYEVAYYLQDQYEIAAVVSATATRNQHIETVYSKQLASS
jgi:hypothetical protein